MSESPASASTERATPPSLADVRAVVESLWPVGGAEPWDAVGLVSGRDTAPIRSVHLAVDAVSATVDEAVGRGADLLITHHPLLLRGVTTVAEDQYKGALLARLIRAECALLAAHTNADVVESGTSAVFAEKLGLRDISPLQRSVDSATRGLGRVGRLGEPTTLGRFARHVAQVLPATAGGLRVAGDYDAVVATVALCGGAGDSLLGVDAVRSADVYITSDLRHHPASEARETAHLSGGPALIDVSHWASEWLWLEAAADGLRRLLPGVDVSVSDLNTDPWDFVVVQ